MDGIVEKKMDRVLLVSPCEKILEKILAGINRVGVPVEAERSGLKALLSLSRNPDVKAVFLDAFLEDMECSEFLSLSRAVSPGLQTVVFSNKDYPVSEVDTFGNENSEVRYLGNLDDLENSSAILQEILEGGVEKNGNKINKNISNGGKGGSGKSSFFISDFFLETPEKEESFCVDFFEMLFSLSSALDVINPALSDHHHRVAYIAASIANELGLPVDEVTRIFQASLLHDLGSIELSNRLSLLKFEDRSPQLHSLLGGTLLSYFAPFASLAPLVRYHHIHWNHGEGKYCQGKPVPDGGHIIHLADRISVLINSDVPILDQVSRLLDTVTKNSGEIFSPDFVAGFLQMAKREAFWLDVTSPHIKNILKRQTFAHSGKLGLEGLRELSRFFAIVIDTRSHFTATHSTGVAKTGAALGSIMGVSSEDTHKLEISGFLHDLGKLAVPPEILEKPGKLTESEFRVIKSHPYHTYNILREVEGLEEITQWASFHHETLAGTGYPFRFSEKEINLGARVVAVADIFTALTEERPYREGLPKDKVIEILFSQMEKNVLDSRVVEALVDNYEEVNKKRQEEQWLAHNTIKDHWKIGRTEEPDT